MRLSKCTSPAFMKKCSRVKISGYFDKDNMINSEYCLENDKVIGNFVVAIEKKAAK